MPNLPRLRKMLPASFKPLARRGKSKDPTSPVAGPRVTADVNVIGRILAGLKASSCAFHAEFIGDKEAKGSCMGYALSADSNGGTTEIPLDSLFGYGSFQKLLQNIALFRIIEEGETFLPPAVWTIMNDSWEKSALHTLNELRVLRDENCRRWPEPKRMPTIEGILTHSHAFTASQRYLFGPDGSFLMCEDTLGEVLASITDADVDENRKAYQYNNLNAIVAGLIIKYAMGSSLAKALHDLVLKPCEMDDTVVDMEKFEKFKAKIQQPSITMFDGTCKTVDVPCYLHDDIELAAGGGYTSIRDMAKLLGYLMKATSDESSVMYKRFFLSKEKTTNEQSVCRSVLSGYRGFLDIEPFGNQSFERICPSSYDDDSLSTRDGKSVEAVWKAGAVKGYGCHYYILLELDLFIVVLANSSGIVDPSHHIGRYLLQEFVQLDERKAIDREMSAVLSRQIAAVEQCTVGILPHQQLDEKLLAGLQGTFVDEISQQHLVILRTDGTLGRDGRLGVDGNPRAEMRGNGSPRARTTQRMRLFKIADDVLALSPDLTDTSPDFYHAWRDYALKIVWEGDTIAKLQRISASSTGRVKNDPKSEMKLVYQRKQQTRQLPQPLKE